MSERPTHPALDAILERMQAAAGRQPMPRLLAVSKTQTADAVAQVAAALQARLTTPVAMGENYVQETLVKQPGLAGLGIEWHLIGHLQSNKAREAAAAFDCVHHAPGLT